MNAFTGDHKHNVFVPVFAPQYQNMVERGGIPGVSLEDNRRGGVWVPLELLKGRLFDKERILPYSAVPR